MGISLKLLAATLSPWGKSLSEMQSKEINSETWQYYICYLIKQKFPSYVNSFSPSQFKICFLSLVTNDSWIEILLFFPFAFPKDSRIHWAPVLETMNNILHRLLISFCNIPFTQTCPSPDAWRCPESQMAPGLMVVPTVLPYLWCFFLEMQLFQSHFFPHTLIGILIFSIFLLITNETICFIKPSVFSMLMQVNLLPIYGWSSF